MRYGATTNAIEATGLRWRAVRRGGRHDTPGVQGKQNEQQAQLTPADMNGAASLVPDLKRAEQPIRSASGICPVRLSDMSLPGVSHFRTIQPVASPYASCQVLISTTAGERRG
jgi:hypothetical protein